MNLANNIRDIPTDAETGKITLAVRLGDTGARRLYLTLVSLPFAISVILSFTTLATLLGLLALPLVIKGAQPVIKGVLGRELIPVIGATGRAMAIWALLTAIALAFLG